MPTTDKLKSNFNLFAQIARELDDFFKAKVHIAGAQQALYQPSSLYQNDIAYLSRSNKSYQYSQWETLNLVELYYNSKFETGKYDTEGQVKVFLNISKFRANVASKMVNINAKDFVFIPEEGEENEWGAWFLSKEFKEWAKENGFAELLDEVIDNLPKQGSVVLKKVQGKIHRVMLMNLRNQQDADSLQTASFVIEEHKDMTIDQMVDMPGWDVSGVEMNFGEKTKVYERYGKVPLDWYKKEKGLPIFEGDEYKTIETISVIILAPTKDAKQDADYGGKLLFMEAVLERPYREVHWDKIDGRWLGVGEIENQFENQKFRNLIANYRRRSLMWGSKKIFQSSDDTIAKNLVKDVRDGEVLRIMPNGEIKPIQMTNEAAVAEFNATESLLDKNSDQISFTYEAATGASLPSGTPFRLGVQISNAVKSYFSKKQDKIGVFMKHIVWDFVVPEFKKQKFEEHMMTILSDEEGVENLRQTMIDLKTDETLLSHVLNGGYYEDPNMVRQMVEQKLQKAKFMYTTIPSGYYDTVKSRVILTITGEDIDVKQAIETLTNLYTILSQKGDPRAEKVLERILSLSGQNIGVFGQPPANLPPQATQQGAPTGSMPAPSNSAMPSPTQTQAKQV